jgi:hypothetical protein
MRGYALWASTRECWPRVLMRSPIDRRQNRLESPAIRRSRDGRRQKQEEESV